jgi:hypothetical protein
MELKYEYESLDLQRVKVSEAIAILQSWESENPEAVEDYISLYSDGESAWAEVCFCRPYTEEELEEMKARDEAHAAHVEQLERETYERLKEKYGN